MERSFSIPCILLFLSVLFTSCHDGRICVDGIGPIVTQTLNIPDFTGIDMTISADVIISQGSTQEVRVTGHQNIIDRLRNDVRGGTWEIDLDGHCFSHYDLTVFVTVPNLEECSLSGSGTITINDFDHQEDVLLNIPGSGEMYVNRFPDLDELRVTISGSGDVNSNNAFLVDELSINISGSGDYYGFPIQSRNCMVNISGSGKCDVFATETLDVVISGSGDVAYKGRPTITTSISGSGKLKDAN